MPLSDPDDVRDHLVAATRRAVAHAVAGTVPLTDAVVRVPSSHYVDPDRWNAERDQVFRRLPLVLALSAELPAANTWVARDVLGVPVLVVRGDDGTVRAFVNSCSHRGAPVAADGRGEGRRLVCPYHAWSYSTRGALVGVLDGESFGHVEPDCHGLTALPCDERAGFVFGGVDPVHGLAVTVDEHLGDYAALLERLGLGECRHLGSQTIPGPNWKIAYDGYLDLYHLPVLHKRTFGADYSRTSVSDAYGPHQRLMQPDQRLERLADRPESAWTDAMITGGIWTIFPHVSIARFEVPRTDGAGSEPMYLVSQLLPGPGVGESRTVQHFLGAFDAETVAPDVVDSRMAFFHHVVADEDYATGFAIQAGLATGAKPYVQFGRNEGAGQRFHAWLDHLLSNEAAESQAEPGIVTPVTG